MRRLLILLAIALVSRSLVAAETVYLIYDEFGRAGDQAHGIADSDRAALMRLLCAVVPVEKWPVVTTESAEAAGTLIDRYFYYFPHGYQVTYDELIAQLLQANHLKPGEPAELTTVPSGKVILPPVPLRGEWLSDRVAIRGFRPRTQGYSWMAELSSDKMSFSDRRNLVPARDNPFHDATLTVVEFDSAEALLSAMDKAGLQALPDGVVLRTGNSLEPVTLLADGPQCNSPAPQLSDFAEAQTLRERLTDPQVAKTVVARAENMPLVIIDFDFISGHGAAVMDVVKSVLEPLGVFKALDPHIVRIDFDRRKKENRDAMREVLLSYKDHLAKTGVRSAALDKAFAEAEAWLKGTTVNRNPDGTVSLMQEINEQVLYALLWRYFSDRQAWVNMSFFIDAPQFRILDGISDSPSFAVSAAGNERLQGVPASRYPQTGAKLFDNFVNVTYGTRGGDVCGSKHTADMIPVALIAPGGGFSGDHITPQQAGSSFASPYVAAVSWLKRLADETSSKDMRTVLMDSVEPSPALLGTVASGGFFDGAAVLAFPGAMPPHYVDTAGMLHRLTAGELQIRFLAEGATSDEAIFPNFANSPQGSLLTLFPCADGSGQTCMWLRRTSKDTPISARVKKITVETPCGDAVCDTAQLSTTVRYIWY
jgi:hypothetical protein